MQSNQALMLLNNTLFASEWCIRVVVMLLNNSTEQSAWGRCSNYQLVASANTKASVSCMFGLTILQFCWLGVGGKFEEQQALNAICKPPKFHWALSVRATLQSATCSLRHFFQFTYYHPLLWL
jgi:hypothetical protein